MVRQEKTRHLWIPSQRLSGRCPITTNPPYCFWKTCSPENRQYLLQSSFFCLHWIFNEKTMKCFPIQIKSVQKKKIIQLWTIFFFKNKLLIIIMESQKVEGLISSVNYEICHCGKKPNSIWRDFKRKSRRRKKRKIEYEMPKPNPFGEKGMAAPSSSNLHYFLFLFMFLLILINGEDPNSDRSWVMIFRLNWVFPTTDLSHCNHCPIFLPSASETAESNEQWI
jgi:hypothetical protein